MIFLECQTCRSILAPDALSIQRPQACPEPHSAVNFQRTIGPFGRQCLLTRQLAQRGVRFVQVYFGDENTTTKKIRPNWDSHEDLTRDHGYWEAVLDIGASALLKDLK